MKLDKDRRKALHKALMAAFPNISDIERLLSYELDKNLEGIAGSNTNLKDVVFKTIEHGEAKGDIDKLENAAYSETPNNQELKIYIKRYRPDLLSVTSNKIDDNEIFETVNDIEIDRQNWQKAKEENTIEAYKNYIDNNEDGVYRTEAFLKLSELEDIKQWNVAKNINTIVAYEKYLVRCPKGNYRDKANSIIENLTEANLWAKSSNTDSYDEYDVYLRKYPNGKYAEDAIKRKEKLKNEHDNWIGIKSTDSIEVYNNYINENPKGKYINEAHERLHELEADKNSWIKAIDANTIEALNNYKKININGKHLEQANKRIEKLEWNLTKETSTLSYEDYIKKCPNSEYAFAAKSYLATQNEDEKQWLKTINEDTAKAYKIFAKKNPYSKYLEIAKKRAEQRKKEEKAWSGALSQNTHQSYKAFIDQYPNSKYKEMVEKKQTTEQPNNEKFKIISYSIIAFVFFVLVYFGFPFLIKGIIGDANERLFHFMSISGIAIPIVVVTFGILDSMGIIQDKKHFKLVGAIVGIVVVFGIYKFIFVTPKPFNVTIIATCGEDGMPYILNDRNLFIRTILGSEVKNEYLNTDSEAEFKNIPGNMKGDTITFHLCEKLSLNKDTTLILSSKKAILLNDEKPILINIDANRKKYIVTLDTISNAVDKTILAHTDTPNVVKNKNLVEISIVPPIHKLRKKYKDLGIIIGGNNFSFDNAQFLIDKSNTNKPIKIEITYKVEINIYKIYFNYSIKENQPIPIEKYADFSGKEALLKDAMEIKNKLKEIKSSNSPNQATLIGLNAMVEKLLYNDKIQGKLTNFATNFSGTKTDYEWKFKKAIQVEEYFYTCLIQSLDTGFQFDIENIGAKNLTDTDKFNILEIQSKK